MIITGLHFPIDMNISGTKIVPYMSFVIFSIFLLKVV